MLTDTIIRTTQPGDKPIHLSDSRGLYLEVSPRGGKWWRLKYRFRGKENRISLGVFPEIGINVARARCDVARRGRPRTAPHNRRQRHERQRQRHERGRRLD